MANPLIGKMAGVSGNAQGIDPNMLTQAAQSAKRMMGMLQGAKNPRQALEAAAQQNPQLNMVMQMCNGRNPQEVFMEQCKRQGVDPNIIIDTLKG